MSLWLMVVNVCTQLGEAERASRLTLHLLIGAIMTQIFLEPPEDSLNVTEDWLSVIFQGCRVHEYFYTVMFVVLY